MHKSPLCLNEKKLTKDKALYLALGQSTQLNMSYTFLDLYYCHMLSNYENDAMSTNLIFLEHFEPKYNGKTMFHLYALNSKVLSLIVEEIKKYDNDDGSNKFRELLFSVVYPNDMGISPFDIAIKN